VGSRTTAPAPSLFEILEEVERRIIVDMLERTNWNQTEAAERFQIPLSTLNQKIKRLGIETRRRANPPRGYGYGADPADFSAGK
jgi:DNA-binding NtrC family response regulator